MILDLKYQMLFDYLTTTLLLICPTGKVFKIVMQRRILRIVSGEAYYTWNKNNTLFLFMLN